jgi:transcriptional regulator with XRE-family HTH domain
LPEELKKEIWAADTIGELITAVPHLSSPLPRENVAKAMRATINLVSKGNIAAFASHLGIPKNTVWMWHGGKALPQLNVLLKICYCLELSLLDFLIPEKVAAKLLKISLQKSSEQLHNKRVSPKSFDSDQVEEVLLATIASGEEPPPTMKEVAQQLGYDRRTISRRFPELCRAISTRCQSYRKALRLREVEQSCQEVQQIALELLNRGVHPSEARVSELMSKPGYFRYEAVRTALQEAQSKARL